MNGHALFDDTAGCALHRIGLGVLFHQIDALDHQVVFIGAQGHLAALALVPAGDDDDFVAFD